MQEKCSCVVQTLLLWQYYTFINNSKIHVEIINWEGGPSTRSLYSRETVWDGHGAVLLRTPLSKLISKQEKEILANMFFSLLDCRDNFVMESSFLLSLLDLKNM